MQNSPGIILYGGELGNNMKASADVEALGLKMIKLAPSNVRFTVSNDATQYRYRLYASHLPAFMKALDGKKTSLLYTFKPIPKDDKELEYFRLPPVILNFEGRMSDDIRDNHILSAFPGAEIREVVKTSNGSDRFTYIIGGLPLEAGAVLANLPGVNHITPQFDGTICIKSIPYYKLALRIARKFLILHNYPSFADEDHFNQFDHQRQNQPGWADEEVDMDNEEEGSGDEHHGGKPFTQDSMESFREWGSRTALGGAVVPPQEPANSPYLDPSGIANGGYFAPYVAALSLFDTETVPRVIRELFYECLGVDDEEAADIYNELAGEFGSIGKTEEGKALAHLFMSIRIAVLGQLAIKAYNNSTGYAGVVMTGYGTHITINSRNISYATVSDLKSGIAKADSHTRALQQIAALMGLSDVDKERLFAVKSMAGIKLLMGSANMNDTLKNSIRPLLKDLQYKTPSWRINASTFERFFELLNVSSPIPDDLPIHHTAVFNDDRLYILLSCFGDFAPTFRVPGGREVPLNTFQASVFDKKAGEKKVVSVNKIGCRTVPLATAHYDWTQVKAEKTILNPYLQPKAKVSMEHFTRFFDDGAMNMILRGLRTFAQTTTVTAGGPAGKRKETDEGEGGSAKKRRTTLAF